jgi:hypothetical protein
MTNRTLVISASAYPLVCVFGGFVERFRVATRDRREGVRETGSPQASQKAGISNGGIGSSLLWIEATTS